MPVAVGAADDDRGGGPSVVRRAPRAASTGRRARSRTSTRRPTSSAGPVDVDELVSRVCGRSRWTRPSGDRRRRRATPRSRRPRRPRGRGACGGTIVSTSTSVVRPTQARFRSSPIASWSASSALRRRRFSAAGTSSARRAAGVPGRDREGRREDLVVADGLEQPQRRLELASVSPQKPTMTSVRERDPGHRLADPGEALEVVLDRVLAAHPAQHRVVARLDRQVQVLADRRAVGHRRDQAVREVPRMRGHEAQPRDRRHAVGRPEPVDRAEQLREVRASVEVLAGGRPCAPVAMCREPRLRPAGRGRRC